MRINDVQLTIPTILMALLVDGIANTISRSCMMKWHLCFNFAIVSEGLQFAK